MLTQPGLGLIVSLPENSPPLARAALEAGADALKVHIRVHHAASGHAFGTLDEERARLEDIRHAASVPLGVVVGDGRSMAGPEELAALVEMGFDFFDAYGHHMPAWMLTRGPMEIVAAIGQDYTNGQIRQLAHRVDAVELAFVPEPEYGRALTAQDIATYGLLARLCERPVIVPTQKAIMPRDLEVLRGTGVAAIMIGAIVTGNTQESLSQACRAYREELDRLGSHCGSEA